MIKISDSEYRGIRAIWRWLESAETTRLSDAAKATFPPELHHDIEEAADVLAGLIMKYVETEDDQD